MIQRTKAKTGSKREKRGKNFIQSGISKSFFFWMRHIVYEILIPPLGVEASLPALEAQSLNHWTAQKFRKFCSLPRSVNLVC